MAIQIKSSFKKDNAKFDFQHFTHRDLKTKYMLQFPEDGFLLLIVLNDSLQIKGHNTTIEVSKNELLFIPKYYFIDIISANEDCKFSAIMFRSPYLSGHEVNPDLYDLYEGFEFLPYKLSEDESEQLLIYFNKIQFYFKPDFRSFGQNIVKANFISLLYEIGAIIRIKKAHPATKVTRKQFLVAKFEKLAVQYFREQRKLSFYANQLYITTKYLTTIVKDITGRNAGEIIDELVVKEAKFLLSNSKNTIGEIAFDLNFGDQSFFGKFFKRQIGLNPTEYRNVSVF